LLRIPSLRHYEFRRSPRHGSENAVIAQTTFKKAACGLSALALLLAGCAQTPMGPTVQVMPGPGKTFDVFQTDQATCKGYAQDAVRGQADAANQQAVGAAVLTTAIGAGLGAAVGSAGGAAGTGAAVGAGAGSVAGAGIGAQNSSMAQMSIQQQYDNAFAQCMYSKGEQVPGYAPIAAAAAPRAMAGPDPLVRSTQVELIRLHYLNGAADGAMGPMTGGAIRSYEQASGLPVDGAVSPRLLARLQSTPTGSGAAAAAPPTTATAPPAGWVQPTTAGQPATPASAPSGWVQPKTQAP
jgi:hypothetical protein